MKALAPALLLLAVSCTSAPAGGGESEAAIEKRAQAIRDEADAEVNRQIAEIEAAANAEAASLPESSANAQ